MNLALIFELDDRIETKNFGTLEILKLKDLKKSKYRYEVLSQSICYTKELFGYECDFSDFILFFVGYQIGNSIEVEDIFDGKKHKIMDVFIELLKLQFLLDKDAELMVDTITPSITLPNGIVLDDSNFEELREILLKSLCVNKFKPQKESIRFEDEERRKRFEVYYKKKAEKTKREMKKNSIENIIRTVKTNLLLFSDKEKLNNMTIYDLMNAYKNTITKEGYERNYSALLAGADKNELDLTHWSIKIAEID